MINSTMPSSHVADNGIKASAGRTTMLAAHNSNADASNGNRPENDMPLSAALVSQSAITMTAQ